MKTFRLTIGMLNTICTTSVILLAISNSHIKDVPLFIFTCLIVLVVCALFLTESLLGLVNYD